MVDLIAGHAQCKLGDGPSTLFWKDSWLTWGVYETVCRYLFRLTSNAYAMMADERVGQLKHKI